MRVLLDECVPKKLKRSMPGHEVRTVADMRWAGIKNGRLLAKAEACFDVFVTVDSSIRFQQSLDRLDLAVVILDVSNNRLDTLEPLMPRVLRAIDGLGPGDLAVVEDA